MRDIRNSVRAIIAKHLGRDEALTADDATLLRDLGADSFDRVELAMEFEEHFNVELDDRTMRKMQTVGDAVAFVSAAYRAAPFDS